MHTTQNITRFLAVLALIASCNAHAAEHNQPTSRPHTHFGSSFPRAGLFLAVKGLFKEFPKNKEAQAPDTHSIFFENNVTHGVLDLPLILEEKQS